MLTNTWKVWDWKWVTFLSAVPQTPGKPYRWVNDCHVGSIVCSSHEDSWCRLHSNQFIISHFNILFWSESVLYSNNINTPVLKVSCVMATVLCSQTSLWCTDLRVKVTGLPLGSPFRVILYSVVGHSVPKVVAPKDERSWYFSKRLSCASPSWGLGALAQCVSKLESPIRMAQ